MLGSTVASPEDGEVEEEQREARGVRAGLDRLRRGGEDNRTVRQTRIR
jgi:hypothetical protein